MLDKYVDALRSGKVNGFGYIDSLSDGQIKILCQIVVAVTRSKIKATDRDGLKYFTLKVNSKVFDKYVKNVIKAYDELVAAQ